MISDGLLETITLQGNAAECAGVVVVGSTTVQTSITSPVRTSIGATISVLLLELGLWLLLMLLKVVGALLVDAVGRPSRWDSAGQ